MEELCCLFDPTDGASGEKRKNNKTDNQLMTDNVKKKTDGSKGRRRGRRSHGKSATLPEESSFLCEPELSSEVLMKDGSYFDSYFESGNDKDPKYNGDNRQIRRNSSRKYRRRKTKISPTKELTPPSGSCADLPDYNLLNNNENFIKKDTIIDNVGKGVNNLRDSNEIFAKTTRRKENSQDKQINNIIEKLERILQGEEYASDFSDDESSDGHSDDGDGTNTFSLPPEPRFGNVEYKLHLVSPSDTRLQHLVTQLKWRLVSGGGVAVYVLGVRDCGRAPGLPPHALTASIRTVRDMCVRVRASCVRVHVRAVRAAPSGASGTSGTHKPRVRHVAELTLHQMSSQQSVELRVAVMGANEAGKSTLVGVLTQGELDNGRGSARLNMFRHVHEVRSGNTSSLSHEILGFDAKGNVINYGCSELMTAERIGQKSAKLVSFLDLAGHSKYQRTTVHGLTGYLPHTAMLLISATAGITSITEEHIGLLLALDLQFFTVITKCELEPSGINVILQKLSLLLENSNKKPLLITDEDGARNCVGPKKLIIDSLKNSQENEDHTTREEDSILPVFPVSCVRGFGLNALHAYLLALEPPALPNPSEESMEFQIDEIFHVCDSGGPVVGGLLYTGTLRTGDRVLIGPLDTGEFVEITVKSIYRNRVPCNFVRAGQSASLGLNHRPENLRQGMVLLSKSVNFGKNVKKPNLCQNCQLNKKRESTKKCAKDKKLKVKLVNGNFVSGTDSCDDGKAVKSTSFSSSDDDVDSSVKDINFNQNCRKNSKEANRNLTVDKMANDILTNSTKSIDRSLVKIVESEMSKAVTSDKVNLFIDKSESESENSLCVCVDDCLWYEDPDNPRGCLFFQATIRLLRHSGAFISPGFQCTVHIGNVRQTAIIEGILSLNSVLHVSTQSTNNQSVCTLFRLSRQPERLTPGRSLLVRARPATLAVGTITHVFPLYT